MSRSWFAGAVSAARLARHGRRGERRPQQQHLGEAAGRRERQRRLWSTSAALQGISDAGGGNRLAGAPGYDASAQYVADRAAAAGLSVSSHNFSYDLDFLAHFTPPELAASPLAGRPGSSSPGSPAARSAATSARCTTRAPPTSRHRSGGRSEPRPERPDQQQHQRLPVSPTTTGCPTGRSRSCSAGRAHSPLKFKLANRSGAGGMILFNEGQPGRTVPLWFDVTGIDVPRWRRPTKRRRISPTGSRTAPTGLDRRLQDRLAAGDLPHAQRDRGDPVRRPRQRDRGGRPPRQRRRRGRSSTTTGRGPQGSWRSPSSCRA